VTRANGPFLAVTVPRGTHRVRLRYAPPGSRAGFSISVASAAIALVAAFRRRRTGNTTAVQGHL
jgi:uncharacterized membrane protein YfhO